MLQDVVCGCVDSVVIIIATVQEKIWWFHGCGDSSPSLPGYDVMK